LSAARKADEGSCVASDFVAGGSTGSSIVGDGAVVNADDGRT
jgi:hypothetical protein